MKFQSASGNDDIRFLKSLTHADIAGLNFIRANPRIHFRKHYREGLRSQIIEVIRQEDLDRAAGGVVVEGVRIYPQATPRRMLRLYRGPFSTSAAAFKEARTFYILRKYLAPENLAQSSEFIVSYRWSRGEMIMLGGLQEYVVGCIVNPWTPCQTGCSRMLYRAMPWPCERMDDLPDEESFLEQMYASVARLNKRVRRMIAETGTMPDLAGVGNLILTPRAQLKLVDINNVTPVKFDSQVHLDDRGYPASDKSVEVLGLLEEKLLGRPWDPTDPLYAHFLNPERIATARFFEKDFRRKHGTNV